MLLNTLSENLCHRDFSVCGAHCCALGKENPSAGEERVQWFTSDEWMLKKQLGLDQGHCQSYEPVHTEVYA